MRFLHFHVYTFDASVTTPPSPPVQITFMDVLAVAKLNTKNKGPSKISAFAAGSFIGEVCITCKIRWPWKQNFHHISTTYQIPSVH